MVGVAGGVDAARWCRPRRRRTARSAPRPGPGRPASSPFAVGFVARVRFGHQRRHQLGVRQMAGRDVRRSASLRRCRPARASYRSLAVAIQVSGNRCSISHDWSSESRALRKRCRFALPLGKPRLLRMLPGIIRPVSAPPARPRRNADRQHQQHKPAAGHCRSTPSMRTIPLPKYKCRVSDCTHRRGRRPCPRRCALQCFPAPEQDGEHAAGEERPQGRIKVPADRWRQATPGWNGNITPARE